MGSRRFVVIAAAAAAALGVGAATASAEPSRDADDRGAVKVETHLSQAQARAAVDPILSEFVPITPARVLDTRTTGSPVGQGQSVTVDVSGLTPANAVAVVLNVTGTAPTAGTYVTAYPSNEGVPFSSNLNLVPGQTRANQVSVALSPERRVNLYNNAGNTHLIADVAGYYVADNASLYNAINPTRVLDTRNTSAVGPGGVVNVDLSFLDSSVTAVTFNLTGVGATTSTFVTAFPTGQSVPLASSLNVAPGETVPNQVTVQIGANRQISLYNGNGWVHLIADLAGYYSSNGGLYFLAISPERAMDTRPGLGLEPDFFIALTGWGTGTEEWAIEGVAGNLTATNPNASGYITVWPGGQSQPFTSNLNLVPGQTAANAVNAGIGFESHPAIQDRSINFANSAGYVDVIFDVNGFFIEVNA